MQHEKLEKDTHDIMASDSTTRTHNRRAARARLRCFSTLAIARRSLLPVPVAL
jgi:hypothetical protein